MEKLTERRLRFQWLFTQWNFIALKKVLMV